MSTVYAIRHKPTGLCMPAMPAGFSYWEPETDNHVGLRPRLLFSLKSAQNALSAWLQGQWKRHQGTDYSFEGIPEGYDEISVKDPKRPRRREDMEIVALSLEEVSQ